MRSAPEQTCHKSCSSCASCSLDGQIPPEVRQAAEQGDAEVQFLLGLAHTGGEGVPEDDAESIRWFLMAAEQGHAGAQYRLALAYGTGEGVTQDLAEALHWWLQAAEQGHAGAQFLVIVYLLHGGPVVLASLYGDSLRFTVLLMGDLL